MPAGRKDKGTGQYGRQRGMGRLRTANRKDVGRLGDWSSHAEDDVFLDRHGNNQGNQHGGERLVSQFNRLVALRSKTPRRGEAAEVSGIRPGSIQVRFPDGRESIAALRRALEKRVVGMSNTLAVGDQVRVEQVRDEDNAQSEWVIVAVEPRRNQIARVDSHNRSLEHVLAANLDVFVAVSAVHNPDFKHGFVDRALLLAAVNSITALVIVSKRDLGDAGDMVALYRGLGYVCIAVDARDLNDPGIVELRQHLVGRTCVVVGQSGVGKSSLINACFPGTNARIGDVAELGFGRHTTTTAVSFVLPGGGRLVDTPGIRECTINGMTALNVALLYPDFASLQPLCHFQDCTHRHEPRCAVKDALDAGALAPSRYASYLSIVEDDLQLGTE